MMMGKQKAAMLLMSLDAATATELLKGLHAEDIQEIAMELARIDSSSQSDTMEQTNIVNEFCASLQQQDARKFSMKTFINETLETILDEEMAKQIQDKIKKASGGQDLFVNIRIASTDELVLALEGEHPQTIAVVLSELDPKKSQEVLARLGEEARLKAVCRMINPELVGSGVKQRMAFTVSERLKGLKGETLSEKPEQTLRKLAVVLSGLETELRDQMLDEIGKHDEETSKTVRNLMITWDDIPSIADRSMQEALRNVESGKLAVALYGANEAIVEKIRSNISERAAASLDEEISLMQDPLEKEVLDAREEVVNPLRDANEQGTLRVKGR
ncbi:MAG: FliG C-terminal domain-containing protein [Planctomycetota bacterium]|jgi:flagellar motor switch protein FliG